jgi:valyl-tRNA synthetase
MADGIAAVQAVRAWRDGVGARPSAKIPARLDADGYEPIAAALARLARLELSAGNGSEPVATVAIPGGAVHVLPTEGVDLGAADRRVAERRERLRGEVARAEGKLSNRGFVEKAPDAVVQAERDKLDRLRAELEAL